MATDQPDTNPDTPNEMPESDAATPTPPPRKSTLIVRCVLFAILIVGVVFLVIDRRARSNSQKFHDALAEALEMNQALVPVYGGVLSALGMLASRPGRQLSRTLQAELSTISDQDIEAVLHELGEQGEQALLDEGLERSGITRSASVDLRYLGQSYTLTVPWQSVEQAASLFHERHYKRYGHSLDLPLELVNVRLSVRGERPWDFDLTEKLTSQEVIESNAGQQHKSIPVHYQRDRLLAGQQLTGPAVITEQVATTWLAEGWQATVDKIGNLLLNRLA